MCLFHATLEEGQQNYQNDCYRSNVSRQFLSGANLNSTDSCGRSSLETFHLVLSAHGLWMYTIVDHANPAALAGVVW